MGIYRNTSTALRIAALVAFAALPAAALADETSQNEIEILRRQRVVLDEQILLLKAELDQVRVDLDKARAERMDARDASESLRRQLRTQEDEIQRLKLELTEVQAAHVQAKLQADAFEHRCKVLQTALEAVRERPTGGDAPRAKERAAPKELPIIRGKVTEVGRDGRLLQLSVGLDAGLKDGQTLEVFRLGNGNRPLYLGTVTLTRVDPAAALGQFRSVTGSDYRPAVGDSVATDLAPKQ